MTTSNLSGKNIPAQERLIHALDVPSVAEAKASVERLGDTLRFYKVGLQLFMADGYFELIDWLLEREKKVFVDLKFFDVPETVGAAVRSLTNRGAHFVTVHGNDAMLQSAVEAKNGIKILAVTVLTSLDKADLEDLGFQCDVERLVLSRAKRALHIGCDGIISSGQEAEALRDTLGNGFLIVTPGIRPVENVDDQKRTVDIEQAFQAGADYIVVGRPIRSASDPHAVAKRMQERIAKLFDAAR